MTTIPEEVTQIIHEVMNLVGPALQQAIADGVAKAFLITDDRHELEHVAAGSPPAMQGIPHPHIMDQMVWSEAYSASLITGRDDYVSAAHADLAVMHFRKRFPNE